MAADTASTVEERLAWEAQWAPRAATVAILAGLTTIAGTLISNLALRGRPQVTLNEGLADIANPTNPHGLLEPLLKHLNDHLLAFTGGQVVTALSGPLTALALIYLYRAIQGRNPGLGRGALIALVAGGVASLVGGLVGPVAIAVTISDFVGSANHTTHAAHDALQPSAALTAGLVAFIGRVALGLGIVLIALNAMRVGLLTRFMGILGIMAGAFMAFPLVQLPIVQAFWLVGIGVLFLGRFPGGVPPAWESGRAEPWPSRQQLLEEKGKLSGGAPAKNAPPPAADPIGPAPDRSGHVRSKKKKRRR
ncbi:MAG: hypothetical protein JWM73_2170 [Solirubrobacterales bacterium]|jgi:hypothetical protein|nr:hypothetical protein [Solirubrobacterales bacterium]